MNGKRIAGWTFGAVVLGGAVFGVNKMKSNDLLGPTATKQTFKVDQVNGKPIPGSKSQSNIDITIVGSNEKKHVAVSNHDLTVGTTYMGCVFKYNGKTDVSVGELASSANAAGFTCP